MTGFASKRVMSAQAFMRIMDMPTKIIWHRLPGRKLKATWEPGARGFELGLKEKDMDPIQDWLRTNIPSTKRLSFDMWLFKEDKHVTMFLLKWSS